MGYYDYGVELSSAKQQQVRRDTGPQDSDPPDPKDDGAK